MAKEDKNSESYVPPEESIQHLVTTYNKMCDLTDSDFLSNDIPSEQMKLHMSNNSGVRFQEYMENNKIQPVRKRGQSASKIKHARKKGANAKRSYFIMEQLAKKMFKPQYILTANNTECE